MNMPLNKQTYMYVCNMHIYTNKHTCMFVICIYITISELCIQTTNELRKPGILAFQTNSGIPYMIDTH